jgi:hypothetical protein
MRLIKSVTALTILLTLSGCFSLDGGTAPVDTTQGSSQSRTYNNNQFSFVFPGSWDVIEPKDFTSDIPRETQVVIRNNIKNDTFTANINIVKNDLQTDKSSLDYAKEILNRQKTGLLDYKETKRELIKLPIGGQDQETYYVEFDARLNATDPITRFIQTYAVKDRGGFIMMASYSQQESTTVIDQLQKMVRSFRVN